LQVIIVVLLEIYPSPHEFIEATVINPAIIILNSIRAATDVEAIIYNLDFMRLRKGCNGFKISLGSLLFDSCLSQGFLRSIDVI
jgi:hypothetical protein